jgi:hypothetical protein
MRHSACEIIMLESARTRCSYFARQIVSGAEVEAYLQDASGVKLDNVFDQYLRATMVPVLKWSIEGTALSYRWSNVVDGFDMPIPVKLTAGSKVVLEPRQE